VSARAEILDRVRRALAERPAAGPVPRDYRGPGGRLVDDQVGLLSERLVDYRAGVRRCAADGVAAAVADWLGERGITSLVVPAGFPSTWLDIGALDIAGDEPPLTPAQLDRLDGVLTTCALAVALTGTIVLDAGPGQGRRALTLVPDYHLVVLRADQIVAGVPDAIAALDPARPLTWISGPSATSDIELQRVEGVHGPRTLDVLIVDGPGAGSASGSGVGEQPG
jgi:L-lactate dehydrogenase complex protein LldG